MRRCRLPKSRKNISGDSVTSCIQSCSIGQRGLTPSVAEELGRALDHHELVKLRARVGSREDRDAIFAELARLTGSEFVYRIGNVGLFYKKNSKILKILIPDS